jgi:hypothetical protein
MSSGAASAGALPAGRVAIIDDATTGEALLGHFDYVGKWQHVKGKFDGRTDGTSTRSTHTGDVAILRFNGTRVRVFGVRGRSGGRAGIALDEQSAGKPVDFYARHTQTHALIYQSPKLAPGVHTVSVVVWGTRDVHGRFYYVNIDGAEVDQ